MMKGTPGQDHGDQSCPWVHFMWPNPTQPIDWLTQPNPTQPNPIEIYDQDQDPVVQDQDQDQDFSLKTKIFCLTTCDTI